jgi:outer membrane PBP1 activator LpoA protein
VGPLTRPALSRLGQIEERPVPVLGLNYLADDTGRDGLYQFGLNPESEAAQVAGRVVREGHEKSIALVSDSDWGYRMLDAYRAVGREELKLSDIIVGFTDQEEYPDSGISPGRKTDTSTRDEGSDSDIRI